MPKKRTYPYTLFCLERKQSDHRLKGKSLKELCDLLGPEWEQLGPDERQGYVETAKQINAGATHFPNGPPMHSQKKDLAGKFDNMGQSLLAQRIGQEQKQYSDVVMKRDIQMRVRENAKNMRFHIMTVNIWFETIGDQSEVYPAEICLIEMSVNDGLRCKWLQKLDPTPIPAGYAGEAKVNSEKYHGIWLDDEELMDEFDEIMLKFKEILGVRDRERYAGQSIRVDNPHGTSLPEPFEFARRKGLLPIYVMPKQKYHVQESLKWMAKRAKVDLQFVLYDLDYLFYRLLNHDMTKVPEKLSQNYALSQLSRDVFLYVPSMSCRFHADNERCDCAGAAASRQGYIICDFCCQIFDIKTIEGRHIPWGLKVPNISLENKFDVDDETTLEVKKRDLSEASSKAPDDVSDLGNTTIGSDLSLMLGGDAFSANLSMVTAMESFSLSYD